MEPRRRKQLIIGLIYAAIVVLIALGVYSMLKPDQTCNDGKKNQNEEGVDCGGVCPACPITSAEPLVAVSSGVLPSGTSGAYDAWATVENTNHVFGSQNFSYNFIFKNAGGIEIGRSSGASFILPVEKKYILATNVALSETPFSVTLNIGEVKWIELENYTEKPALEIVNKAYNETTSGVGFSEMRGLLKNESPFDFEVIKIRIILKDANGQIIATNSTEMRTVKSGEEREFRASWPSRFSGEVRAIETQPDVNVFDSQAFAKRYFKPEKFQQYQ